MCWKVCIIHTMTAFSPESDINLCQVTAGHKSRGLLARQNKHVPCHISNIISIVTENAPQWHLLDLYQLFWFEHWGVLIPKPKQHKDHLFTECEGKEGTCQVADKTLSLFFQSKGSNKFLLTLLMCCMFLNICLSVMGINWHTLSILMKLHKNSRPVDVTQYWYYITVYHIKLHNILEDNVPWKWYNETAKCWFIDNWNWKSMPNWIPVVCIWSRKKHV